MREIAKNDENKNEGGGSFIRDGGSKMDGY